MDKTPVLKNSFPVAWRILFTFVIQVLSGNYSSTEQVNSIQQVLAYCLITGPEVDIGEIIYSDLGPEVPGALSKKSKRPKSKRPPLRPITGLPSTLDEGTRKSKPLPESTATPPKDLGGNVQPLDIDLTSTTFSKGMAKTTPRPEGPLRDKDLGGNIPPADMEPIHPIVADLLGTGAKYQVDQTQSTRLRAFLLSNDEAQESEEDILGAGEETQAASIAETHHQSPPP
ncbi:hypothetical protein Tco_0095062, partial [Tanacetum coccineum]